MLSFFCLLSGYMIVIFGGGGNAFTWLQNLVDTCSEFGVDYSLIFNERKTVCLKYSHCGDLTVLVVCLNGQKLKWEANVKLMGNIITSNLDDMDDIELNIWEYFGQVNKQLSDFQRLKHDVLSELFTTYCNSFYGSLAWDLISKQREEIFFCMSTV